MAKSDVRKDVNVISVLFNTTVCLAFNKKSEYVCGLVSPLSFPGTLMTYSWKWRMMTPLKYSSNKQAGTEWDPVCNQYTLVILYHLPSFQVHEQTTFTRSRATTPYTCITIPLSRIFLLLVYECSLTASISILCII